MEIPDANVLLYATNRTSAHHRSCRTWLETSLGGSEPIGFAWNVLLAVLRLSTKAQVFEQPLKANQAIDVIEHWLSQPASVVIHPGERHSAFLRALLQPVGTAGNLTSDAHLAALAIEHGATLVSFDTDFARFKGLSWRQPD